MVRDGARRRPGWRVASVVLVVMVSACTGGGGTSSADDYRDAYPQMARLFAATEGWGYLDDGVSNAYAQGIANATVECLRNDGFGGKPGLPYVLQGPRPHTSKADPAFIIDGFPLAADVVAVIGYGFGSDWEYRVGARPGDFAFRLSPRDQDLFGQFRPGEDVDEAGARCAYVSFGEQSAIASTPGISLIDRLDELLAESDFADAYRALTDGMWAGRDAAWAGHVMSWRSCVREAEIGGDFEGRGDSLMGRFVTAYDSYVVAGAQAATHNRLQAEEIALATVDMHCALDGSDALDQIERAAGELMAAHPETFDEIERLRTTLQARAQTFPPVNGDAQQ